jgi:hypothetical protein
MLPSLAEEAPIWNSDRPALLTDYYVPLVGEILLPSCAGQYPRKNIPVSVNSVNLTAVPPYFVQRKKLQIYAISTTYGFQPSTGQALVRSMAPCAKPPRVGEP